MNHINRPIAIRMEFMGFDDASARGLSGTERAARSLLRRRLAGAKRIEAVSEARGGQGAR
ncbi:MAG: hypothetical protein H0U97_01165 [Gammaproteobacteria bacterium]|nr:hypothetical protein [Gammaproteobacteria bacterium]